MQEQLQTLLNSLKEAGFNPTQDEFKRIIYDRADVVNRLHTVGARPVVRKSQGKALTDFITGQEIKRYRKENPQSKAHDNSLKTIFRDATPSAVKEAFEALPSEFDELKSIENFRLVNGQLQEK